MDKLLNFLNYLWNNYYTRGLIIYLIYAIVFYFALSPLCKKFFISLIKKTKTNWDNEIYGKTRLWLKLLGILIGVNLIYKLYFQDISNYYYELLYNILVSAEYFILYVIFYRTIKISFKYFSKKYSDVITKNAANLLKVLLDIFVISIFVLLILKTWGINITPLLASAGIVGFAVGIASKSIIENFLSGLILFADKSINVGDIIILPDGTTGSIEEINVRTTKLKTFDGNIVIIPNSDLLNEKIVNKSLNKSLSDIAGEKRVSVTLGISYGDDVSKAKDLLKTYLLDLDGANPNSVVIYVDSLADWSVNITGKIMVQADKRSYLLEKQILEKVYKEFPKNGLSFPFPTYTIVKVEKLKS